MKRLLGAIDILGAILLVLLFFKIIGPKWVLLVGVLIAAKGLFLRGTWVSWVDFGVGIFMILLFIAPYTLLNFIAALWLLQKGIRSMF